MRLLLVDQNSTGMVGLMTVNQAVWLFAQGTGKVAFALAHFIFC
jgi:hypothetical protein